MPYPKQTWTDEVPSTTPLKYKISQSADGDVAPNAEIVLVTPVTAGSPVNATRLNYMEEGIETAQDTAESAIAAAEAALEEAQSRIAKPSNPSKTGVLQQAPNGDNSLRAIKQTVQIQVVPDTIAVDTVSGIAYFFIPSTMDGMELVRAQAFVSIAGVTNPTTVQVRNITKYPSNDTLSTAISIASDGTIGTAGSVNAAYDNVSTNDKIKVYVTAQSTTAKPLGLWVILEYQLP